MRTGISSEIVALLFPDVHAAIPPDIFVGVHTECFSGFHLDVPAIIFSECIRHLLL